MQLFKDVCKYQALEAAWHQVRASAANSDSWEIRAEAQNFSLKASSNLRSLQARISAKKFKFAASKGVLISKPGSTKKRPVVIAPIESRITQRALLQVVQSIPKIKAELTAGFNFGGVLGSGFGVPGAVAKAVACAQQGGYFIRTDIKAFFTAVPRQKVIDDICSEFGGDKPFITLFRAAVDTEIKDSESFGEDIRLFPLADEGVAQGSSLSPLICNYLLRDFDRVMNDRGVVCIRYIDDFILFAKSRAGATKALDSALLQLSALGLGAYNPFDAKDSTKAEHGAADKGFTFLGCDIKPDKVRPSEAKWKALIVKVHAVFENCLKSIGDPSSAIRSRDGIETFSGATLAASSIIRAWGNTYSFCSDDRLMNSIDLQLGEMFISFRKQFAARIARYSDLDRRKSMGLFSLNDCNRDEEKFSARKLCLKEKSI